MFRRWLSNFFRNNKTKIKQIGKLFGLLILIGIVAATVFSKLGHRNPTVNDNSGQVYNPSATVISGGNISKEEFEKEDNLVETFVDYCNNQKLESAYELLTDECKEKFYPTLKDFKTKYYSIIFQEKREYSLQSWVSNSNYNTYKVTFTQDLLSSGEYDNTEKYEDYITIVTDKEDNEDKKLNINGYIITEVLNKNTQTNELEIEALSEEIYMNYVIYTINIKNKTDTKIALDELKNNESIKLIGTDDINYRLNNKNLKAINLQIAGNGKRNLKLKFNKQFGSDVLGETIEFKNVIIDYEKYMKNSQDYSDYKDLKIRLR